MKHEVYRIHTPPNTTQIGQKPRGEGAGEGDSPIVVGSANAWTIAIEVTYVFAFASRILDKLEFN